MASGMTHPGFQGDLISLINKHNLDGLANTPDFILAGLMVNTFETYRITKDACERWHGTPPQRIPSPMGDLISSGAVGEVRADDHCGSAYPCAHRGHDVGVEHPVVAPPGGRLMADGRVSNVENPLVGKTLNGPAWAHNDGPCDDSCYRPGHDH